MKFVFMLLAFSAHAEGRLVHGRGTYSQPWQGSAEINADLNANGQCGGEARRITDYVTHTIPNPKGFFKVTVIAEADYECSEGYLK